MTVTSIWDVVRDGGDGLTSGRVQARNLGSLGSLAANYEALTGHQTTDQSSTVMWIQALQSPSGGHLQDYVYVKDSVTNGTLQAVPKSGDPMRIPLHGPCRWHRRYHPQTAHDDRHLSKKY